MIHIYLTEEESELVMQQVRKTYKECKINYNVTRDRFTASAIGAGGEFAVSKLFNHEWRGYDFNKRHEADTPYGEVRCTQYKTGKLILNSRDEPKKHRPFIHVISLGGRWFKIVGWLYGYEVMTDENIFNRPQFVERLWAVDNDKLRTIDELLHKT